MSRGILRAHSHIGRRPPRADRLRGPAPANGLSEGHAGRCWIAEAVQCVVVLSAVAEIGGAWLVWQGVREHRGWLWIGTDVTGLGTYALVATCSPTRTSGCQGGA